MLQPRLILSAGTTAGFLTVVFGAFGAHVLKHHLDPYHLEVFNKGVYYQGLHTMALLVTGLLMQQQAPRKLSTAGIFFIIGIFLFSGSLYLLALTGIAYFGIITPVGGTAFLLGWASLTIGIWKQQCPPS